MTAPITEDRLAEIALRANGYATRCYVCDAVARVVVPGTSRALCAVCAPNVPGAVLPLVSSYADSLDLVAEVRRLTAALEIARREGAEAMRERCDVELDCEERRHRALERDVKATLEERAAAWERGVAIESARVKIAVLPLDVPGGES